MSPRHVVVVGDVLLDRDLVGRVDRLCPDAPVPVLDVERQSCGPGGAGLTALLCRAPGVEVTLVAAVADDAEGDRLRAALALAGVRLVALPHAGATRVKTRVRNDGASLLRFDEGGPGTPMGPLTAAAFEALEAADVVVMSCYGAGMSAHPGIRRALGGLVQRVPVLWDPHPAGDPPVPGATLVTPNLSEARTLSAEPQARPAELACRLLHRWDAGHVCVTTGDTGAWLASRGGSLRQVTTVPIEGDSCGAGDRFVASVATALAGGLSVSEAADAGVADAGAWVASGGTSAYRASHHDRAAAASCTESRATISGAAGRVATLTPATPDATLDEARAIRSAGGTVVATGGCFDILHAGHVSCLEAARGHGDLLVVLLNSDRSVRRLKGRGRPVQPALDRARVLLGLECVDRVLEFEEDTPERLLAELRPDVWVKGGDYSEDDLPEAAQVRSWGGRIERSPYLDGRSTSGILAGAR